MNLLMVTEFHLIMKLVFCLLIIVLIRITHLHVVAL